MKNLSKIFGGFYFFIFLTGCLSVGSGPLDNSISVKLGQTRVKYKLPRGFCLDRSASSFIGSQETLVVTNCIEVNSGGKIYYSRRPVETIVNITFTNSVVPKNVSQEKYLLVISERMEFEKFLVTSSDRKLIFGQKKSKNNFFNVNFQRVSSSKQREFVRKYFFVVDKKLVVMTILSFQKPRRNKYSPFEDFIKKLSQPSS